MNPLIMIPARMAATRLPNKPLALIGDAPMIVRAYRQAEASGLPVVVAAGDPEIVDAVEAAGGRAILTMSHVGGGLVSHDTDGKAIPLETHADGEFEATLQDALNPGVVSVTATVVAGQDADLLAGELDLHEQAAEVHDESAGPSLQSYAGWLGAGVLVIGLVGWAALRKGNARNRSAGGVA